MYPGIHAKSAPDRPAVIMAGSGETMTYGDLDERSSRLARVLHDAGLRRGDVLALLAENTIRYLEVYWAAMRSGLYLVAINRHLAPTEVAHIVSDSDARAMVASAGLRELAEATVPLTPKIAHRYAFGGAVAGHESYEAALAGAGEPLAEQPRGSTMLYSSGTTGLPKGVKNPIPGVPVDHPAADMIVPLVKGVFGIGPDDAYLSPGPLYHAAPLRWAGAVHAVGGTVVVMEKFDAEQALAAIERYRVTTAQFVPTMFVRMLKLPEQTRTRYDVSSLRMAVHAAAPCPVDVKQRMIDWWGPVIREYYSATEANGITIIDSSKWLAKPGSVGQAALGVIHICDDFGKELPTGEVGLVYFERDQVAFEYHNDPEKTRAAQHPEHRLWTTVGDVGYVDEEGYLFLTDRKAFMIISGGVNIYPQEVENVLTLHPKVYDVAVIGVPDDEMGEQVKAVVQPAEGVSGSPEFAAELIAYVRDRIAHFKAPRSVDFVAELPRTPTGKLLKNKVREPYLAGSGVAG